AVFLFVGIVALGLAFISPNLAALVSKRGGRDSVGQALGAQNAANSLGQAMGPLLGSALFLWHVKAPYLLGAGLLAGVALIAAWNANTEKGKE
ncbi:MAG: MFS transporter, partial [Gemmatimonadales bacterium]